MLLSRLRLTCTSVLVATVMLGCGKKDRNTSIPDSVTLPPSEEAVSSAATPAADPPSGNPVSGPVTKAEVDRWEKGLAGEMKAVQDAAAKMKSSNLSAVVGYLTPQLGGIDTTMLTGAQREEMRKGNEAQLQRMQQDVPADVIAAIRPRAAELRKKDLELVAARVKGAGM